MIKRKPTARASTAGKTFVSAVKPTVTKMPIIKTEKNTSTDARPHATISSPPSIAHVSTDTSSSKSDVPTCHECNKVFKRKEHLAQHVKLHLGLRPFKCDEPNCNKAFSRKEHLMRHVVSHTGKKQFDCPICHKLFSRKDNLNKHKK